MTIERVGVVGCGQMGAGIAEVCARAGLHTVIREIDAATAELGRSRLIGSLDRSVSRGRMTEDEREASTSRLVFTTDLAEMADRQLIIGGWLDVQMRLNEYHDDECYLYCDNKAHCKRTAEEYERVRAAWRAQRIDPEHKFMFDHITMLQIYDHSLGKWKIVWVEVPEVESDFDYNQLIGDSNGC